MLNAVVMIILSTIVTLTTATCSKVRPPIPAVTDTCAYWCANENGMDIPKSLYKLNIFESIHGIWFKDLWV